MRTTATASSPATSGERWPAAAAIPSAGLTAGRRGRPLVAAGRLVASAGRWVLGRRRGGGRRLGDWVRRAGGGDGGAVTRTVSCTRM